MLTVAKISPSDSYDFPTSRPHHVFGISFFISISSYCTFSTNASIADDVLYIQLHLFMDACFAVPLSRYPILSKCQLIFFELSDKKCERSTIKEAHISNFILYNCLHIVNIRNRNYVQLSIFTKLTTTKKISLTRHGRRTLHTWIHDNQVESMRWINFSHIFFVKGELCFQMMYTVRLIISGVIVEAR